MKYARTLMISGLHAAGLLTTAASVMGSYSYMLEADGNGSNLLAGSFAFGLGVAIFVGWEFAFNSRSKTRRVVAATIALTAAMVSGYTLYQNAELPEVQAAQVAGQAKAEAQRQATLTAAKTAEDNATEIRSQLAALREQNAADMQAQAKLQADIDLGIEPKANTKRLDALKKGMDTRNRTIQGLLDKLPASGGYSKPADEKPTEAGQGDTTALPHAIDTAKLVRASVYEILTVLFLLFATWLRSDKQAADDQQANAVAALVTTAQDAMDALQAVIHDAQSAVGALQRQQRDALDALAHGIKTAKETVDKLVEDGINSLKDEAHGIHLAAANQHLAMGKLLAQYTGALDKAGQDAQAAADTALATVANAVARLDAALQRSSVTVAGATKPDAGATEYASTPATDGVASQNQGVGKTDLLNLLENRRIETDSQGLITTEEVMLVTGWGRDRSKNIKEEAYKCGYLDRMPQGKGFVYFYPSREKAVQVEAGNVIQLSSVRGK